MRKIAISALFSVLIGVVGPFFVQQAKAVLNYDPAYNYNLIITDDQMTDSYNMSAARIQEFLDSRKGSLKGYSKTFSDGTVKTAAQMISEAAIANQISPKVLITTLQKEQSLIDSPVSSVRALDYALGYGCLDGTGCQAKYAGFDVQMNAAAGGYRRYLNNLAVNNRTTASSTAWSVGIKKTICDIDKGGNCIAGTYIDVTPANAATAALFTYTPHPHGNYLFWVTWNRYNFNQHRVYPDGTLLQAKGSADVYILQNGVKRKFSSQKVLLSRYSLNQVVTVTPDALFQYDTGTPIYYANYTLLIAPNKGVYLVSADYKQPIRSKKALLQTGLDPKSAVKVGWNVLDNIPLGPSITDKDIYPAGAILQDASTGGIYFVKDGVRYPVPSGDIYKSQFGTQKAKRVPAAELASYPRSVAVGFRDGTLVKSKSARTIYFISNGYRLPIASADAAKAYGFDKLMKSVITTNDKSLNVHPLGPILDVDSNMVTLASQ